MKILIDMNLSPDWVVRFAASDIESIHWSAVGAPNAKDSEIMEFARANRFIVFTHDLDFSAMLAATQAESPSVIQMRTQDVLSDVMTAKLIGVVKEHEADLNTGALITIDEARSRLRILPLRKK